MNDIGALNAGTKATATAIDFSISTSSWTAPWAWPSATPTWSPYQSERFNSWGYPTRLRQPGRSAAPSPTCSPAAEARRRIGVLEWKPRPTRFSSTLDAFYSKFENSQILRGIEFPLQWGGSAGDCTVNVQSAICRPGPAIRAGYTVQDGLVTAGTYDNVKGVIRNDFNGRDSEITSIGWNTKFQASADWGFALDLNYSKVDRTDTILESYSGTGRNIVGQLDTLGFTLDDDGVTHLTSNINYADPNLIKSDQPARLGWRHHRRWPGRLSEHPNDRGRDEGRSPDRPS
jgi:iron complex outermembrane receptor protein